MPMKKTRDERSRRVSVATRRYIGRRIVWKVTRRKHPQDRGSRLTGNEKRRRALSKRQMLQEVAAATAGLAGCDENGKEIKFCLGLKSGCNRRRGNRRWWYSFLQNWDDPLQCRWGFVFRPVVSSWRQDNQFSVGNLGIVFFPTLLHWFEEFLFSTVCFSGCLSLFLFCASCRSTVAGKRGGIFARLYTIRTGGEWKGWISWMSVVMTANLVIGCSDWSWTALYLDTEWSVHQDGAQLRNNWIHDNRLPTGDGWYAGTWYGWNRDPPTAVGIEVLVYVRWLMSKCRTAVVHRQTVAIRTVPKIQLPHSKDRCCPKWKNGHNAGKFNALLPDRCPARGYFASGCTVSTLVAWVGPLAEVKAPLRWNKVHDKPNRFPPCKFFQSPSRFQHCRRMLSTFEQLTM